MADFDVAFSRTMKAEGGYKLTNDPVDLGGMTYAGIARNKHPKWSGWLFVDRGDIPPTDMVRELYTAEFWMPIKGNSIFDQEIANSIYDFAVNAGVGVAVNLAQIVAGVQADGDVGMKSLTALNGLDGKAFKLAYALAKVARYRDIIKRNPSQKKYITGWLTRALEGAA